MDEKELNQIITSMKQSDDDRIIIIDYENTAFPIEPYHDIFDVNKTIGQLSQWILNRIDEFDIKDDLKPNVLKDIGQYILNNDLLRTDNLKDRIENIEIKSENMDTTTSLLFDIGYEFITNTVNMKEIPKEIVDYIDYESIGRDNLFNEHGEVVAFYGDPNHRLQYIIYDYFE